MSAEPFQAVALLSEDINVLAESMQRATNPDWPEATFLRSKQLTARIEHIRASEMEAFPIQVSAQIFIASFAIGKLSGRLAHLSELLETKSHPSKTHDISRVAA